MNYGVPKKKGCEKLCTNADFLFFFSIFSDLEVVIQTVCYGIAKICITFTSHNLEEAWRRGVLFFNKNLFALRFVVT